MNLLNAGKPLKFKDMIEVKFTLLDKADEDKDVTKLIAKEERYKVKLKCIEVSYNGYLNG